jgi:uncharacterized OsmC-like protein
MASVLKPLFAELAENCRADPSLAVGEMRAVCDSSPDDPLQWSVTGSPGAGVLAVGQHPSIGGDGSVPCPGELVTMAIAACMDGTIRFLADLLEIQLERVRVEVVNRADVRGLLRVHDDVAAPENVGFTMKVRVETRAAAPEILTKLRDAAEVNSAVLNMIRCATPVPVEWDLGQPSPVS